MSTGAVRTLWRGCANAWECDENGHLNVKRYLVKAYEALDFLALELGLPSSDEPDPVAALRTAELHVNFLAEARPGAPLRIDGSIAATAQDGFEAGLVMRHGDGRAAATFVARLEHIDPATGATFAIPSRARRAIEAWRAPHTPEAVARSQSLDAPWPKLGAARAEALDLCQIGRGVWTADEADSRGRVRPAAFMGRISDSAHPLFGETSDALDAGTGGALLEARFKFLASPNAGERYEIRSGFAEIGSKTARAVHAFLDPRDGSPIAIMGGTPVHLDLTARKAVPPPAEVLAVMTRWLRPELNAPGE